MRLSLPLVLLAALPAACVTNSADPNDAEQVTSNLELDNGGFDTADEAPQFGEAALYADAQIEADADVADDMAADPTLLAMDRPDALARDLVVLWGRMPPDPTATDGRDWSGELRVSRGGILIRRRIGFENLTDRVMPRTRPDAIEFRSLTRPFADGLALRVFDPTPDAADPIQLTYRSADGTREYSIDLRQLADGPVVVDAGDGNRLIAAGRHRDDVCRHGTMRGRWHALAPNAGVYLGVVANAAGVPIGHVRGIYGHRRNGDPVVFGKFIDREGHFTGLIAGHYGPGTFEARWIDRAGDHGGIKGVTFEGPSLRGGGFLARWAESTCVQ